MLNCKWVCSDFRLKRDSGRRAALTPIRATVMPSVHFNESSITRADSDSLMKTPLNNALIPALNREHTLSNCDGKYYMQIQVNIDAR